MQPGEVWRLVNELAANHRYDLIDAVGELVTAILDMNRRLPVRQILAGDIGDARQPTASPRRPNLHHVPTFNGRSLPKTPSDLSLRCSAERSMPTKAAVREMLPPNRVTWASRYSRSNTSRASRNGSVMISLPLSHLTTVGAMAVISFGSMSECTDSVESPGVMINSQSTTLRSCRTFPGQG